MELVAPPPSPTLASAGLGYPPFYRTRNARASSLYQLLEAYFDDVKAQWEDRFQKTYGYDTKSKFVLYQPRSKNTKAEHPLEFLARVLIHIPEPNQHSILYYGEYARRRRNNSRKKPPPGANDSSATDRKTLRRRWANLIRRVFKTDPLICKNCGGRMRVVSFITEPGVIRRILDHLQNRQRQSRDPPEPPRLGRA